MTKTHYFSLTTAFLISLFITISGFTQNTDHATISVQASGEVEVPANTLHFHVTITQFNELPKEAFDRHKELERFLTDLLIQEDISEKNIAANPISISQTRRQQEGTGYQTRQQVTIQLDDVTQFENMQLTLIENGFTNFSGNFSAKDLTQARDEALEQAVKEAYRKAEMLAAAAGKTITGVQSIEYGTQSDISPRSRGLQVAFEADSGSLLQFEHMLTVRENVFIIFRVGV